MTSLEYKVGDLIAAAKHMEVDAIAHQCNCFNTMKSGIAPQIARAWPAVEEVDQSTKKGDYEKLGKVTFIRDATGLWVFNLYGQFKFGRGGQGRMYTHTGALEEALWRMAAVLPPGMSVGLPKLGAGLGGGDWGEISTIIERALFAQNVTIYVLDKKEIPNDSN